MESGGIKRMLGLLEFSCSNGAIDFGVFLTGNSAGGTIWWHEVPSPIHR